MSDAVERAKRDLHRLRQEHAMTQASLQDLQARIDDVTIFLRMAEFYSDETAEMSGRARGGVSGAAVRATVDYIKQAGQPVHTRVLLDILKDRGIQIGGNNPVANLSGFLSRSDELINTRSSGWALAEWGADAADVARPGRVFVDGEMNAGRLAEANLNRMVRKDVVYAGGGPAIAILDKTARPEPVNGTSFAAPVSASGLFGDPPEPPAHSDEEVEAESVKLPDDLDDDIPF